MPPWATCSFVHTAPLPHRLPSSFPPCPAAPKQHVTQHRPAGMPPSSPNPRFSTATSRAYMRSRVGKGWTGMQRCRLLPHAQSEENASDCALVPAPSTHMVLRNSTHILFRGAFLATRGTLADPYCSCIRSARMRALPCPTPPCPPSCHLS